MATTSVDTSSAFDFTSLNGTSTSTSTSSTADAQSRFLKLLTTQLQNQDPLNPMDNAQMTSQIAQLNMVDGINKMNTTMQTLLASMNGSQTMQAASMVNHGVLVPGSTMALASGAAVGGYTLNSAADNVKLTIKDANGLAIRTMSLGAGKAGINSFSWDGKADSGATAADGNYTFSIEATQGGSNVTANALTLGIVSSVTNGSDGLTVNVNGRGSFKLSEIQQIF
ncbi:MAG: flagellar hook assembly protein FlgD [Rhodocyclaceae bacterium]|nr:MAG: flagellar hook assembly protein FlgD [Rhodocyclaceae bacterium]